MYQKASCRKRSTFNYQQIAPKLCCNYKLTWSTTVTCTIFLFSQVKTLFSLLYRKTNFMKVCLLFSHRLFKCQQLSRESMSCRVFRFYSIATSKLIYLAKTFQCQFYFLIGDLFQSVLLGEDRRARCSRINASVDVAFIFTFKVLMKHL